MTDKEKAERALYAAAVKKFGGAAQFVVALEELAELSKELAKCLRENPQNPGAAARRPQVAEEIADVKNMLAQVEYIMGIESVVEQAREEKLLRLAVRMGRVGWPEGGTCEHFGVNPGYNWACRSCSKPCAQGGRRG